MALWKNCIMETFYYDGPSDSAPCQVRIDGDKIVVSYKDENYVRMVDYKGDDRGVGHYVLDCPEVQGRATLHRLTKDSASIEGYWEEGQGRGMWRIKLA